MVKINRKVEYALIALKHLHQAADEVVTAKELCDQYQLPFDVVSKVLQSLAASGMVRSLQGAHGGYQLADRLDRYSFYDLNETLVGPMQYAYCLTDHDASRCALTGTCTVIAPVIQLSDRIEELYRTVTVADLVAVDDDRADVVRMRHAATADDLRPTSASAAS